MLAKKLRIKIITIKDLIGYLRKNPLPKLKKTAIVRKIVTAELPTLHGNFHLSVYKSLYNQKEHSVLIKGKIRNSSLVRVHSQCITGDVFKSFRCDCGKQLEKAMELIEKNGSGIIIYLNQEGRGIGFTNKIKAYTLQEKGYDTVEANTQLGFPADLRDYRIAAAILKDLHIRKIQLLTNNLDKKNQLLSYGIEVIKRIPLEIIPNDSNKKYLATKKQKLHHKLIFV
jgi:3,4-dihydroxy 2-butanone 4-phosphate synthase/GTP cyclohydrolase II